MAYASFIRKHENSLNADAFQNWMRVVRNLVVNSNIDRADRLQGGLRAIRVLLRHSEEILAYLSELRAIDGLQSFPRRQLAEESLKARLILNHEGWRAPIDRAERHDYFQGQIEFLLDFCGAIDKDKFEAIEDWNSETHQELQIRFTEYLLKSEAMFTAANLDRSNFVWQRALLAIGDYLFPMSAQRKSLLVYAPTEAHSWKRLLRGYQEHEADGRTLLKQLFDRLHTEQPFIDQLQEIIVRADGLESWREALVKSPSPIEYCEKRTIRENSDGHVYLLSKMQMNSWRAELFSYQFYCDHLCQIQPQGGLAPLEPKYQYAIGMDDEPSIKLYWQIEAVLVTFSVQWTEGNFEISVRKEDLEQVPASCKAICENAGFTQSVTGFKRVVSVGEFLAYLDDFRDCLIRISSDNL